MVSQLHDNLGDKELRAKIIAVALRISPSTPDEAKTRSTHKLEGLRSSNKSKGVQ